ncbi:MAG: arginase family protein [Chloroflexi bacterium]|nr:arginase family protein [Chloroflexota bacterium]
MTLLYFPMWQGMGRACTLEPAARALRDHLGDAAETIAVPVDSAGDLMERSGVIGLDVIARQLRDAQHALEMHEPQRLATLGGDCGIEVATIGWLNSHLHGDLTVVWFDAHADLNTPESSPSGAFHGMPLRTLLGEGPEVLAPLVPRPLWPEQVLMVGVREFDPPEADYVADNRMRVFHPQRNAADTDSLFAALTALGTRPVYVHFDLDVLDPAGFPYTEFATAGGLNVSDAVRLVARILDQYQVVGMSLTEYADPNGHGLDEIRPLLEQFGRVARG